MSISPLECNTPNARAEHGKDERVFVEAFYKVLEYHYRLVKALSKRYRHEA